mmetsp:Transcript_94790/g.268344  ORF Transcript_94790/g.268344 Transcript_94790/m.268344 type:complete len:372 (-) Transcript_94790:81-1196(-)
MMSGASARDLEAATVAAPVPQPPVQRDGGQDIGATVDALLRIGPVAEDAERIEKNASQGGAKGERARIARDTLGILAAGCYDAPTGRVSIRDQLERSVAASTFYPDAGWRFSPGLAPPGRGGGAIEVWCCTTLCAARRLARDSASPPGVLNFASARNPGGGFATGAQAQEESIARSSGIYPCLTKYFDEFFAPHRRAESGEYTHAMIYSPAVPVFRDDHGCLLARPYAADFLTSPAPNRGVMEEKEGRKGSGRGRGSARGRRSAGGAAGQALSPQRANEVLRERSARVLDAFARHGATDLVLGAWGCGVFRNDPWDVARIFKSHLEARFRGNFRRIVFAVLDEKMAHDMATVFGTPVVDAAAAAEEGSDAA